MDESLHFVSMTHAAKEFQRKETEQRLVRIFLGKEDFKNNWWD